MREETFEVIAKPKEGEKIQYVAIYILKWAELKKAGLVSDDDAKFFFREKEDLIKTSKE